MKLDKTKVVRPQKLEMAWWWWWWFFFCFFPVDWLCFIVGSGLHVWWKKKQKSCWTRSYLILQLFYYFFFFCECLSSENGFWTRFDFLFLLPFLHLFEDKRNLLSEFFIAILRKKFLSFFPNRGFQNQIKYQRF